MNYKKGGGLRIEEEEERCGGAAATLVWGARRGRRLERLWPADGEVAEADSHAPDVLKSPALLSGLSWTDPNTRTHATRWSGRCSSLRPFPTPARAGVRSPAQTTRGSASSHAFHPLLHRRPKLSTRWSAPLPYPAAFRRSGLNTRCQPSVSCSRRPSSNRKHTYVRTHMLSRPSSSSPSEKLFPLLSTP
jgi:hypothetical protein